MKPHYKLHLCGRIVRLQRTPLEPTFILILLRLKAEVGKAKDCEIAQLLGLSKSAFFERKKRESFPVKELQLLAARCPDLKLDTHYIVTGQRRLAK